MSVELRNLCFSYRSRTIFDGLSLVFPARTLTAVVGPNGSGKTTLLKLCAGLLKPSGGDIILSGKPASAMDTREMAASLAYLPQFPVLPSGFSSLDCVVMGRIGAKGAGFLDASSDRRNALCALERVGASDLADRPPESLSGGEFARVAVARALAQETPIILLDEPAAHLDIGRAIALMTLLNELASEGRTVITAVHDIALARAKSANAVLLSSGHIVADGDPKSVLSRGNIAQVFEADAGELEKVGV